MGRIQDWRDRIRTGGYEISDGGDERIATDMGLFGMGYDDLVRGGGRDWEGYTQRTRAGEKGLGSELRGVFLRIGRGGPRGQIRRPPGNRLEVSFLSLDVGDLGVGGLRRRISDGG